MVKLQAYKASMTSCVHLHMQAVITSEGKPAKNNVVDKHLNSKRSKLAGSSLLFPRETKLTETTMEKEHAATDDVFRQHDCLSPGAGDILPSD